jgi:hypothetical protein
VIKSLFVSSVRGSCTGKSSCVEIDSFAGVVVSDVGIDWDIWEIVFEDCLRVLVDVDIGDRLDFACTATGFGECSDSFKGSEVGK